MAQLAQCLGFDLANALAGHGEAPAHFLQRVLQTVFETVAHLDDLLLTLGQGAQHVRGLVLQIHVDDGLRGRDRRTVLNKFAEVGTPLLTDWRFKRYGRLPDPEHLANLGNWNVHALSNLFRPGLAPQFLHQLTGDAGQLVDDLDHVHRQADGARLIGNGAADSLANPPRRVGRKLVAAAVLELFDRLHQADIALLDQVEELY